MSQPSRACSNAAVTDTCAWVAQGEHDDAGDSVKCIANALDDADAFGPNAVADALADGADIIADANAQRQPWPGLSRSGWQLLCLSLDDFLASREQVPKPHSGSLRLLGLVFCQHMHYYVVNIDVLWPVPVEPCQGRHAKHVQ